jgi:hypothetical protein
MTYSTALAIVLALISLGLIVALARINRPDGTCHTCGALVEDDDVECDECWLDRQL